ncbi:hypothetical protein LEP1GSC198_0910 [Leptospira kirschneri str. JB]|nr:hypothetical protein LEP1GSC198_0910 [Leptospira kirschneri str. JB]
MELKKEFNEMFFTKAFETKAKLSPELSVSLLRSLEVTQRLTSMGRSTGRV